MGVSVFIQAENTNAVGQLQFSRLNTIKFICQGDPGVVYLFFQDGSVYELGCSSSKSESLIRVLKTRDNSWPCMCYLPAPHKALVICAMCDKPEHTVAVSAIATAYNKVRWELNKAVDGSRAAVTGVAYVPQFDVIVANDAFNNRFLFINPWDGCHLRSLKYDFPQLIPKEILHVEDFNIHCNKLFILYSNLLPYPASHRGFSIAIFTIDAVFCNT